MAGATDNEPTHGSHHAHSDTQAGRQADSSKATQGKARQHEKRREETTAAARRHTTHESVCTHHTLTHITHAHVSHHQDTTPMPSHASNPLREKSRCASVCPSVSVSIPSIHAVRHTHPLLRRAFVSFSVRRTLPRLLGLSLLNQSPTLTALIN